MKKTTSIILLFLLSLFINHVESFAINEPSEYAGTEVISSFITFGDDQRRNSPPVSGFVYILNEDELSDDCQLMVGFDRPTVVAELYSHLLPKCKRYTNFYRAVQNVNNTVAVLVGATSLMSFGRAPGYTYLDDTSNITIHISMFAWQRLPLIKAQNTYITLTSDLGAFYAFIRSPVYIVIITVLCLFYAITAAVGIHFLYQAAATKGWTIDAQKQILLSDIFLTVFRLLHLAVFTKNEFYLETQVSYIYGVISSLFFWLPFIVGTTSYTLTGFNWIRIISSLEQNKFLRIIKKPLIIFFYSLVPIAIILIFISRFSGSAVFFILLSLLVLVGFFETFVFLVFGTRVMRYISDANQQMGSKSRIQKNVTRFILLSVVCWVIVVVVCGIFLISAFLSGDSIAIPFIVGLLRDIMALSLAILILLTLNTSKRSKTSSHQMSSKQDVSGSASALE